jgi:glycosyltransferase involved in cell wall biosynthesis
LTDQPDPTSNEAAPKVEVFHNILWSKYKGGVFGELYRQARDQGMPVRFIQIAETERSRLSLGGIDLSYHQYPYELLFRGAYEDVPKLEMGLRTFIRVFRSKATLVIIPCYNRMEYWGMLIGALLRRKRRAVFCDSTALDRPQTWLKSLLKWIFFRCCHGFFAYGKRSGEYLKMHGVPAAKIYTRCQSAALPHDYSPAKALAQRIERFPDADAPRLLYVGRLAAEKKLDTLLLGLAIVRKEFPKAILAIVGAGPLQRSLQRQTEELSLASAVLWLGSMDIQNVQLEYAKATCLVLPSISEPWGLVVNEALSYGCPVIVSDRCGCVPELVIEGVTGFCFATGDSKELAARIAMCIREFSRNAASAMQCIDHMQNFTPATAGLQMLIGCRSILSS